MTWSRPFQGWFAICGLRITTIINLSTKFEVFIFTHYHGLFTLLITMAENILRS